MRRFVRALFATMALFGAAAHAQSADPMARRHQGFFFRPSLGIGYFHAATTGSAQDVTLSGGGGALGLNLGGSIAEGLILSAHLWTVAAASPSISASGSTATFTDGVVNLAALGPSVTYYFMPANVYLTGSVGFGRLSVSKNTTTNTSVGPAGNLALGKEWWVSDHWGLGLAGQLTLGSNKDNGPDSVTWHTYAATFAFSATYN